MFGNVGNNNSNEKNVNTKILSFFGELSCIQLSYWNEKLSIKINPLQGVSPEGLRQYDYTRRITTAITQEKCAALAEKIKEKLMPAISNGEVPEKIVNVGVQVNDKGSAVFIEYKKDEKGVPHVYLTLYTNIGQDGKANKDNTFCYKFAKTTVTENYDPDTGEGVEVSVDAEFLFFYEKLASMADICGTAAHSINSDNTAKSPSSNVSKGGFNAQGNYTQPVNNYSAPVSSFSDADFPLS